MGAQCFNVITGNLSSTWTKNTHNVRSNVMLKIFKVAHHFVVRKPTHNGWSYLLSGRFYDSGFGKKYIKISSIPFNV